MTKKALIKIIGKQCLDNDNDRIELTTVGTLEETEDSYIFRYNEEQEPPHSPIKAKLSISKDENTL